MRHIDAMEDMMTEKRVTSLRLPPDLMRFIKIRAIMNDRSLNQEITEVIRELKTKEAEESQLGGTNSSASEQ